MSVTWKTNENCAFEYINYGAWNVVLYFIVHETCYRTNQWHLFAPSKQSEWWHTLYRMRLLSSWITIYFTKLAYI